MVCRRGIPAHRLLVESYVQWDPLWTLRLGAVPFWMRFNMQPEYEALRDQPAFAALPPRHPLPAPLSLSDVDRFRDRTDRAYAAAWHEA